MDGGGNRTTSVGSAPRRRLVVALVATAVVSTLASACVSASDASGPATTETPPTSQVDPAVTLGSTPDSSGSTPGTSGSTLPPVVERTPPLLGATLPGGDATQIHAWEEGLGTRFDLVRRFTRWDDPFGTDGFDELLATGHWIHVSIRPVSVHGRVIAWRDLADARPGEPLYGQMVAWADRLVEFGPKVLVTLNHEPETTDSAANGDADDFVAAWRRFAELLRERGGDDLGLVWTMTGGAFSDERADVWYPGDDVVDVVGADLYNWFGCQGTDRPWRSMNDLLAEPLAFAAAHDKPLAIPEFASVEDPDRPGAKAAWIADAADTFTSPEVADRLFYAAWFDVTAPGGQWPECVWDHDSSESSASAFAEMVRSVTDH